MPPYNVIIIGAGKIGALYDKPGSEHRLTHAHAFSADPAFRLAGFVDANPQAALQAAAMWGTRAYRSLEEVWQAEAPVDVACVAVPDQQQASILRELVERPLRLVFAEKPFTTDPHTASEVAAAMSRRALPVAVNYTRRYLPALRELRQSIRTQLLGRLLHGHCYYGKGVVHNGSHLVNLLLYFFDDLVVCGKIAQITDYHGGDPTISAWLRAGDAVITLAAVDSRAVTIFELDLIFEKQRVRLLDSGARLEVQARQPSPVFPGYCCFDSPSLADTELYSALPHALLNLRGFLERREELRCPAAEAIKTLELCHALSKL